MTDTKFTQSKDFRSIQNAKLLELLPPSATVRPN
jgi:hypothetical protein